MTDQQPETPRVPDEGGEVEMPAPTVWPMVLGVGLTLLAAGVVTNYAASAVGLVLAVAAAVGWVRELFPGRGVVMVERVPPEQRPRPVEGVAGRVETLRPGMPGHRASIPIKIHPYSAGVKGGIVGGLVMLVPALAYGLLRGHGIQGIWFPINLLAGMLLPSFGAMTDEQLEQFNPLALVLATMIHAVVSVGLGLIYGVLLPTLPGERPIIWGGIVLPLLWTGAIYAFMQVLNPALNARVEWPWFIASQFVYGLAAGMVVVRSEQVYVRQPPGGPGPGQQ
jgi:hypothetical protein